MESIRDPVRVEEILAALDKASIGVNRDSGRESSRWEWRARMRCQITQPGGTCETREIVTRNLGADGAAFLVDGFLHRDTVCTLQIITADNAWVDVGATVVRCRYISGRIHEVGVRFHESLDPRRVIKDQFVGRVLLVDDAADFANLMSRALAKRGLEVATCYNGSDALTKAAERPFDVVLLDVDMPGLTGPETARQLRAQGIAVPILAISGNDQPEVRQECLAAGCEDLIVKPIRPDDLVAAVRRQLADCPPLISDLADSPDFADLAQAFVSSLPARIKAIEAALLAHEQTELLRLSRDLKSIASSSGGCGFEPLSRAARQLEVALLKEPDWDAVAAEVRAITQLAARVRPIRQ